MMNLLDWNMLLQQKKYRSLLCEPFLFYLWTNLHLICPRTKQKLLLTNVFSFLFNKILQGHVLHYNIIAIRVFFPNICQTEMKHHHVLTVMLLQYAWSTAHSAVIILIYLIMVFPQTHLSTTSDFFWTGRLNR